MLTLRKRKKLIKLPQKHRSYSPKWKPRSLLILLLQRKLRQMPRLNKKDLLKRRLTNKLKLSRKRKTRKPQKKLKLTRLPLKIKLVKNKRLLTKKLN